MITDRNIKNIQNFDKLKPNHRRVFRYHLRKKCEKIINHLMFVLANHEKLRLQPEDVIKIKELEELVKLFTKIKEKQTYKNLFRN